MAERSRCQGWSLGERRGSLMTGLLAGVGRVEPGEELAEEVVELLLAVGRQVSPHRRRVAGRCRGRRQARGGAGRRMGSGMRLLRWGRRGAAGTTRPARATPSR